MFEVAALAEQNIIETDYSLNNSKIIKMGQITSNNHGGSHSSNGSRNSAHRKSSFGPGDEREKKKQSQSIFTRDLNKIRSSQKRSKDGNGSNVGASGCSTSNTYPSISSAAGQRPITISEMNAYNVEKNCEDSSSVSIVSTPTTKINNSLNGTNDSLIKTHLTGTTSTNNKKKEFHKVGETYHKTDSCYYKTPDGGYHKLPPDSYHKMSEICYNKMPDGSFKRIDELLNGQHKSNGESSTIPSINSQNSNQNKVKNQMIRFLKRSKSHTPSTIKELQKSKEKEREQHLINNNVNNRDGNTSVNGNNSTSNSTNRRVMITMMENGGLPIVATSKSSSSKRDHSSTNKEHRNKEKVIINNKKNRFVYHK